jgi:hypothetical protein
MKLSSKGSLLAISIILIVGIIILRDILLVNIPSIALSLMFVSVMVLLPYEKLMSFVFFMFPLLTGIPGYIMTFAYIILLIKGPRLVNSQVIPVVLVIILELLNESYRGLPGLYSGMLSFISFIAVFFYFLNISPKRNLDIKLCLLMYSVGVTFTILVIYFNLISMNELEMVLSGELRKGAMGVANNSIDTMKGHLAMNANTIGYYALTVLAITTYSIKYKLYSSIITIPLFTVALIGGLLSFSRSFFLCVLAFFFFLFVLSKWKGKVQLTIMITIVVLLALFFFSEFFTSIFNVMIVRAQNDNIETGGERTLLFNAYNMAWIQNVFYVLFGAGVISHRETMNLMNSMHSGLQQIWVCLGVIGLGTFTFPVIRAVKKTPLLILLPFLITLLYDQSIQFLNPYPMMLPMLPVIMIPRLFAKKNIL